MNLGFYIFWTLLRASIRRNREEGRKPPGIEGKNSTGGQGYQGPCPPDGQHRYFFKLYALDTMLDLDSLATKADVEAAMDGHVVGETQLMGVYKKVNP